MRAVSPRLSVVVATFNEPELAPWLGRVAAIVTPIGAEILIVDDSDAAAFARLQELAPHGVELRVLAGAKRGKGAAIRQGIQESRGDVILCADADVDAKVLGRIPDFYERIASGRADAVIAERSSRGEYDRGFVRSFLSIGLLVAQRVVIFQSTRFFDTQCGFKAWRRDVARELAARQVVDGGMYDIEYLYQAVRRGLRVDQVPIAPMPEIRASRINLLRCIVNDPLALLRVKLRGLAGRYSG
jgi:glycosyltransferase involved in cell wall biosynthesis